MFHAHETGPEFERARERRIAAHLPTGWDDPDHLESLPTLSVSQADDLKIDTGDYRVWLSRCGEGITVEQLRGGRWETAVNIPENPTTWRGR